MIPEAIQAVADVAQKSSSYVTGQFVLDGALLIAGLKVVEAVVNKVRKRNGGPRPGQGEACREHGEAISALVEFKDNTKGSIEQIQADIRQIRDAVVK